MKVSHRGWTCSAHPCQGGFSWLGVLVTPIAAGFATRGIDIELIVRRGKSAGAVAGLVPGQCGVVIAMTTAFQTALITGGLLLVLPLASWIGARRRRSPTVAGTPLPMHNEADASLSGFRYGSALPD